MTGTALTVGRAVAEPGGDEERRRRCARERQRRWRARDKVGDHSVGPITLRAEAVEVALEHGLLSEDDLNDRRRLSAAAEEILNAALAGKYA
jgi:hypothetical protein